ncbi:Helix-turn-helix domain-containing protein [Micromonospora pallida]|uniref:Helix-turn-helix domain-containing protein n=2 Tax=Micromonospora pallida TaxID=145854 RepID=A0A1C6TAW1_9ACTN|nr:Helix-turn-helix domain-containing protein [Micromonospora pallida]
MADFLLSELRESRAARGLSQDDFGRLINYSGSHVSAVECGNRAPTKEYVEKVDEALGTGGIYTRLLRRVLTIDAAPVWLREWIEIEREAASLLWFEPAYVPGALQTPDYARATLAGGRFTPEEVEQRTVSRLERQSLLSREPAPLIVFVLDEAVLRSGPDSPGLMHAQLQRLVDSAELPTVQLHVVPASAGLYLGKAGAFILAEMPDGSRVAHVDTQLNAQIVSGPADIASLGKAWEAVRSEALPRRQSLDLIKEAAKTWT